MRKHLIATLLLACGTSLVPTAMNAAPEPSAQSPATAAINGTVLDENNEPVIGASVAQKGNAGNASVTDVDGHFKIRVAPGTTLVISYVGYKSTEMPAAKDMVVYLQPTTANLDQLVVVGYGSQKKANLTGAVATVDVARVMDSRPVQDVTKALQGAVPGLTITTAEGGIGASSTINIRGIGTLSNGQTSNPLIVVDGVPVDNLDFVNPEDIAEISVLKDAASASIYGTRAAFGVILITTKSPSKQDKVSISYNNNFAWSSATKMPEFAHNVETIEMSLQSAYRTGLSGQLKSEVGGMNYVDLLPFAQKWWNQHNGKPYTSYREVMPYVDENNVGDYYIDGNGNWLRYAEWNVGKTLFHAAPSQKHNLSVEGTSGNTQYRLSFGYDSKENLFRFNPEKMRRYMANANISTQLFSFLKAGARISFTQRDFSEPNLDRNSHQYLWRWPSFMEFYGWKRDSEGTILSFRNDIDNRKDAHIDTYIDRQTRLQAWALANIIDGLTLQADFTYDVRTANGNIAWSYSEAWNTWSNVAWTKWFAPGTGQAGTYAGKSNDVDSRWTMNVFATYDKTFLKDNHIKVMLGGSAEENKYSYFYARRYGIMDYNLVNPALTDGGPEGTKMTISSSDSHRATAGFFGRINYDYKGIYLFEANGRYDGSSRFPAKDQWAFFPSFSAGYRFTEEAYWKNLKEYISNGKIRASYGHVGNEAIGNNMFISTISKYAAGNVNWLNAAGSGKISMATSPSLVSSSLTWERVITSDIGLDLGFFDNSLNLSFDWYQRNTKDMLAPGASLPSVMGASAPYQNAGELRTRGWELGINWNHSFGDADVFASFSVGDAQTKVMKWDNAQGLLYSYVPGNNSNRYYEGQTFGDIWAFTFDRFFTEDDFNGKDANGNWILKDGIASQKQLEKGTFKFGPGDVKFKDLDGDGDINGGDPKMVRYNGKLYAPTRDKAAYDELMNRAKNDPELAKLIESVPVATLDNHGDFKVHGNALPRYEYSFRLGGAWKGFDIDLFFQGVGKRKLWAMNSQVIPFAQTTGSLYSHQTADNTNTYIFNDKHEIVGFNIDQNNLYPGSFGGSFGYTPQWRQMTWQGINNFWCSDRYLTNMAYLRLKTLTVGYTLPYDWTKAALIQKARLYFTCENPFFIYNGASKFGMDPEIATADAGTYSSMGTGSFGRTNMMTRAYSFGVQVTF